MLNTKCFLAVVAVCSLCASARAGDPLLDLFDIEVDFGGLTTWKASDNPGALTITFITDPVSNKTTYQAVGEWTDATWSFQFVIGFDPDPFVSSAVVQFANLGPATQDFIVTVTTPAAPSLSAPTTMTGSISGFVGDGDGLTDIFGNGATVQTFGGRPYYEALVDGISVRQLYSGAQLHSAALALTNNVNSQSFIGEVGPAVSTTIGIRNAFRLTNGDNVGFTNTFLIIPTPGALSLMLVAGAMVFLRRR